jgi:hypothetical protein
MFVCFTTYFPYSIFGPRRLGRHHTSGMRASDLISSLGCERRHLRTAISAAICRWKRPRASLQTICVRARGSIRTVKHTRPLCCRVDVARNSRPRVTHLFQLRARQLCAVGVYCIATRGRWLSAAGHVYTLAHSVQCEPDSKGV